MHKREKADVLGCGPSRRSNAVSSCTPTFPCVPLLPCGYEVQVNWDQGEVTWPIVQSTLMILEAKTQGRLRRRSRHRILEKFRNTTKSDRLRPYNIGF